MCLRHVAVDILDLVFYVVKPCGLADGHQLFRGTDCFSLQGRGDSQNSIDIVLSILVTTEVVTAMKMMIFGVLAPCRLV